MPAVHRSIVMPGIPVETLLLALRVATMWNMQAIRDNIICDLVDSDIYLSRRVEVALTHNIKGWIKPCLMKLAELEENISYIQSRQLGLEATYMLACLREHMSGYGCSNCGNRKKNKSRTTCYSCGHSLGHDSASLASERFDLIAAENGWDWISEFS